MSHEYINEAGRRESFPSSATIIFTFAVFFGEQVIVQGATLIIISGQGSRGVFLLHHELSQTVTKSRLTGAIMI